MLLVLRAGTESRLVYFTLASRTTTNHLEAALLRILKFSETGTAVPLGNEIVLVLFFISKRKRRSKNRVFAKRGCCHDCMLCCRSHAAAASQRQAYPYPLPLPSTHTVSSLLQQQPFLSPAPNQTYALAISAQARCADSISH